ncbi:phosphatase PAP2 family protein [Nocardia sp. NPDC051030]|uniref:phosphatase PAP2 family protein n=1 Tax=Nocardia sp. NPDC051030 TaxID=3155162 RepID=UPI00343E5761
MLIALVLAAAALVLTSVVVWHGGPIGPDAGWLQAFIDRRSAGWTTAAKTVSALGDTGTMAGVASVACVVLVWRRLWERAALVAIASGGAGVIVAVGKPLTGRDRPPVVDHLVTETNLSYPSGHALGSTVVIGVLVALIVPLLRMAARVALVLVAALFVVAVGVSRLYLGVHWPTDVLAGWLIGCCWLTLCLTFRPYLRSLLARVTGGRAAGV